MGICLSLVHIYQPYILVAAKGASAVLFDVLLSQRVINFDTMPEDATLRPAASACTLKSLIVEGDHDKVVCGSEDIRWIQQHLPHFHIDQYGMLVHRRIILDDDL